MTAPPALHRAPTPRELHHARFHGLEPLGDGPVVVVHGNCQAEALRVALGAGDGDGGAPGVRVPPVHELTADDVPRLRALLRVADVVVTQPVRDGYHGLPVGTREVLAAAPRARHVVVPVVRHHVLHPFQCLVRVPGAGDPPVVPYHDLRTLVRAAGLAPLHPDDAALRAVGDASLDELRRRQARHATLAVDDLLVAAGPAAAHTVNHPGNPVLVGLAGRVQQALGLPVSAADPGRTLLRSVLAPLEPQVLAACGFDTTAPRAHWVVGGTAVPDEDVVAAQLGWYRDHPEVVEQGLLRHASTLEVLAG